MKDINTKPLRKVTKLKSKFEDDFQGLPIKLLKRQAPTTVLLRTTLTLMITLYESLILLAMGSNHLLCQARRLGWFGAGCGEGWDEALTARTGPLK